LMEIDCSRTCGETPRERATRDATASTKTKTPGRGKDRGDRTARTAPPRDEVVQRQIALRTEGNQLQVDGCTASTCAKSFDALEAPSAPAWTSCGRFADILRTFRGHLADVSRTPRGHGDGHRVVTVTSPRRHVVQRVRALVGWRLWVPFLGVGLCVGLRTTPAPINRPSCLFGRGDGPAKSRRTDAPRAEFEALLCPVVGCLFFCRPTSADPHIVCWEFKGFAVAARVPAVLPQNGA